MSGSDSDEDLINLFTGRQRSTRVVCPHCRDIHFRTVPCPDAPAYRPGLLSSVNYEAAGPSVPPPLPQAPSRVRKPNAPREPRPPQAVTSLPPDLPDLVDDPDSDDDEDQVEFDDDVNGNLPDPIDPYLNDDAVVEEPPTESTADLKWRNYDCPANPIQRNDLDPEGIKNFYPKPKFVQSTASGARNIPIWANRMSDYFKLFFDVAIDQEHYGIMDRFVEIINVYGNQYYGPTAVEPSRAWKAVDIPELYKFFALIMYGGMVKVPEFRFLWSTTPPYAQLYGRDFIQAAMSENRFRAIWRCLHYVDATGLDADGRTALIRQDGFWSVSLFCSDLADKFQYFFNPDQYVDVDEMCIFFKGRHRCRVYNPNKPNKYHLKAFCFNDSDTGYTINFYMYRGKEEQRPPDVTATSWPVLKLLEGRRWEYRNFILGLDNWYTSVPLARSLLQRGIHVVGTIKTNRSGLPASGKMKDGKQARGDLKVMATPLPEGGDIYFSAWQDSKPVHILSTFAPVIAETSRRGKVNGRFTRVDLPMPSVIPIYNSAMGGTDLCDQYSSYYEFEHRTTKWHRRIFTHFLIVAMRNAHICYLRDIKNRNRPTTSSFRVFIETVVCELLGVKTPLFNPNDEAHEHVYDMDFDRESGDDDEFEDVDVGDDFNYSDFSALVPTTRPPVKSRKWWLEGEGVHRRMTGRDHWPVYTQKQVMTAMEEGPPKRVDSRMHCYVCEKKCASSCASCRVALCLYGDTQLENCFWRFHKIVDFTHKTST